jgi:hypothetical protein
MVIEKTSTESINYYVYGWSIDIYRICKLEMSMIIA